MTFRFSIMLFAADWGNSLAAMSFSVDMDTDTTRVLTISSDGEFQSTQDEKRAERIMRSHRNKPESFNVAASALLQTTEVSTLDLMANVHSSALRLWPLSSSKTSDHAIVTHICSDDWAPGALALAGSLKRFSLQADLVVMLPRNVSTPVRNLLAKVFDRVYIEEPVIPHPAVSRKNGDCVTLQLRTWLLPYKKVLYMDADMIAFANPEPLLQTYAEISAQADDRREFNGGMWVCEPNSSTFDVLAAKLRTYKQQKGKRAGIQPFMNFAFPKCNKTGPAAKSFGHAGCWQLNLTKSHNRFSRFLKLAEIKRLSSGEVGLYDTVHFSGDWGEPSVKPWMVGCMAKRDSTTKHTELHKAILQLWIDAFKLVEIPKGMEHLVEIDCPAFKCSQQQKELTYVVFAKQLDCVTQTTVKSLYDSGSPKKVIVVAPANACAENRSTLRTGTLCIDEDTLLEDVNRASVKAWLVSRFGDTDSISNLAGWYVQKLLKIGLAEMDLKLNLGDHYVLWDSSMIMLREFCPFSADGRVNVMESGDASQNDACSGKHERMFMQLVGIPYAYSERRRMTFHSNHLVANKSAMSEFLNVLRTSFSADSNNSHWTHAILQAACPTLEDCTCGFPEMAAYVAWLKQKYPSVVSEVPKQFVNAEDVDLVRSPEGKKVRVHRVPCCPDQHRFNFDRMNGNLAVKFNRSSTCEGPPQLSIAERKKLHRTLHSRLTPKLT